MTTNTPKKSISAILGVFLLILILFSFQANHFQNTQPLQNQNSRPKAPISSPTFSKLKAQNSSSIMTNGAVTNSEQKENINPIADAKIERANKYTNYGSSTNLAVAGPYPTYYRRSFLKFDLSTIPSRSNIENAKLFLYKHDETGDQHSGFVSAWRVKDDSWKENTINWYNRPRNSNSIIDSTFIPQFEIHEWYTWDVTDWIENQYKEDGIVSIRLTMKDEREDWLGAEPWFYSKEYGNHIPSLEITYTSLPPHRTKSSIALK